MAQSKLSREIAFEAARLLYLREEQDYQRAKWRAGRQLRGSVLRGDDLPSDRDVREQIRLLSRIHEAERQTDDVRAMRAAAAQLLRVLRRFQPRVFGGVVTGRMGAEPEIRVALFADSLAAVTATLDAAEIGYLATRAPIGHEPPIGVIARLRIEEEFAFELTIYAMDWLTCFESGSFGVRADDQATQRDLEELLARDDPERSVTAGPGVEPRDVDRFAIYRSLLLPLEEVMQSPRWHPEGDALYHSLQVFALARDELPYDEELLLAALLHDVGKAIDRHDHVRAGLEALEGFITPRTAWLIEHHGEVAALRDGTLGVRSRRRLEKDESYEELLLLADCDRRGRVRGAEVPDVDEALAYIRDLAEACGE